MIRTPFFSSLNAYFAQFAQSAQKYEIKLVYSLDDIYHIEDVLNHFETSLTTYHLFIMLSQTFLFSFLAFNRIGSPAVCLKINGLLSEKNSSYKNLSDKTNSLTFYYDALYSHFSY